jgi:hypothetical protein
VGRQPTRAARRGRGTSRSGVLRGALGGNRGAAGRACGDPTHGRPHHARRRGNRELPRDHTANGRPSAADVVSACRRDDVYLRDLSPMSQAFQGRTVRIAVRDPAGNARIVAAYRAALVALAADRGDAGPVPAIRPGVLLEHLVRPTIHKRQQTRLISGTVRRRLQREGAHQPARRLNRPAGPKHCAPSAPGSPHGYCSDAGGRPGPKSPHQLNSSDS